jgi:hypothetical protein
MPRTSPTGLRRGRTQSRSLRDVGRIQHHSMVRPSLLPNKMTAPL